ncbi:MAG: hypothetical protein EOM26_06115 [Alphaproteobacteria bacterium]|nr:hypothetical protein [Alphaproteobacteria bacterium]
MSSFHSPFLLIAGVALLGVSGCGFSPLYRSSSEEGDRSSAVDLLSRTEIAMIPDRNGVYLRNRLIDRFYLNGRPADPVFTIQIARIEEQVTDLDITKSSDATRGQLKLNTAFRLQDDAGNVLLDRSVSAVTSYNILAGEFTNRVSEESARRNALDDLARQIESLVVLYLNRTR